MNLADPELELVDPTPNVHIMFIHFDQTFFGTKLASRAVVRWSKRMYSCAGVCSYEGRGGLCDIALSEPLLKLRPRKDLVETLLHEMIHAFLFITRRDQDRDGHGPNFQAHMHRINRAAGLNISIYHDFHDEVELYQTHWWRCDGPCQTRRPHFGIVRRCVNHAPGPKDFWWSDHQRKCGGNFIKFKEPENTRKKAVPAKPKGDITKFITTTTKSGPPVGEPKIIPNESKRPLLTKSNGSSTVVAVKKGVKTINTPNFIPPAVFTGKGHMIPGSKDRSISVNVAEAVRNVWANKQLPNNTTGAAYLKGKLTTQSSIIQKLNTDKSPNNGHLNSSRNNIGQKAIKHRADSPHTDSPPVKIKKIDDYFKTTATSLLKDIYGGDIEITESKNTNKLVAVQTGVSNSKLVQVDCPICKLRIDESVINQHLDECLNKDMISQLCTSTDESNQPYAKPDCPNLNKPPVKVEPLVKLEPVKDEKQVKPSLKKMLYNLPPIPPYKGKQDDVDSSLNFTIMRKDLDRSITTFRGTFRSNTIHQNAVVKEPKNLDDNLNWEDVLGHEEPTEFDPKVVENVKCIVKKIDFEKHLRKSDNYVLVKEEIDLPSGFLPSFISEEANTIKLPPVKLEPGIDVITALREQKCPCCGNKVTKAIDEHLDECLAFFVNSQEPEEGASTSFANQTIVIDDEDDIFDESQVLNATGTKLPCPCCLKMVENNDMNSHLDSCLS